MTPAQKHLPEIIRISQASFHPCISIRPPGSKSLTNRALLCASLAEGKSEIHGALFADDTLAMIDAVSTLGVDVFTDALTSSITVVGTDITQSARHVAIDARQSGTTSRFLLPVLGLRSTKGIMSGDPQLLSRPFGPLLEALQSLGVEIESLGEVGHLPVSICGPALGGTIEMAGHLSSQFISGMLIAGALMPRGVEIELTSQLVSTPYVDMTRTIMSNFGVRIDGLSVQNSQYQASAYKVEPDASAASYMFAAACITGGEVTIEGLGASTIQGDFGFINILEKMGAEIIREPDSTTVIGPPHLVGIDIDLADMSDTAQTLAVVAVFAETPTRVRGIGFIRGKESNRIFAMVTELRRAGILAEENEDGFTIFPGNPKGTQFNTYGDHRMAMSLALLGLRTPNVDILEPGCVTKTYPDFFEHLSLFCL